MPGGRGATAGGQRSPRLAAWWLLLRLLLLPLSQRGLLPVLQQQRGAVSWAAAGGTAHAAGAAWSGAPLRPAAPAQPATGTAQLRSCRLRDAVRQAIGALTRAGAACWPRVWTKRIQIVSRLYKGQEAWKKARG